jgi:hypothetical protein
VICLDEMGPQRARSTPGKRLVRAQAQDQADGTMRPAKRAAPEAAYGRRGKGYRFGAWRPAAAEAVTKPYARSTMANWVDCLAHVNAWRPIDGPQV